MLLRRSRFIHQLPVGKDRTLIVHAISHMRLPADRDIGALVDHFAEPRRIPEDCDAMTALFPDARDAKAELRDIVERTVLELQSRQILTEQTPEEELAAVGAELAEKHGRDPGRAARTLPPRAAGGRRSPTGRSAAPTGSPISAAAGQRVDVLLFGDCDMQMEADFLRREAARRGIDLRVAATFPDDARFAAEHKHDAILIGALRARHSIAEARSHGRQPARGSISPQAAQMLDGACARTARRRS